MTTTPMDPTRTPPAAPTMPVDWRTEPPPVYATGVHVAPTLREFSILFDEAAPFAGRNAPDADPTASRSRIVASMRMAPEAYFRAVCTLAASWNKFVLQALPPSQPRPRFKLTDSGGIQLEGAEP